MPVTVKVEHVLPTRLRVRVPEKRGDPAFFRNAVERLSQHGGVTGITANPATGGMLIEHDGDLPALLAFAASQELFDAIEPEMFIVRGETDDDVAQLTDFTSAVFFALSALQMTRGRVTGSATENAWQAYGATTLLKEPRAGILFAGLCLVQLLRGEFFGSATALLFYALVVQQIGDTRRLKDWTEAGQQL